ncbi:MAG: hypothetical protein O7C75_15375 [Verrucomicrobia bacterium]|nr:hypothetical protein [Verrucomicrobiota bacterium]
MKKINRLVLTASLFAFTGICATSYASRDDLPTLFAEDTLFYVEIPSVTQIQEDWEDSPFYEIFQREDVKEFIEAVWEVIKSDNGLGFDDLDDLFEDEEDQEIIEELLQGQIAFGISRWDILSMIPNPLAPRNPKETSKTGMPDFWLIFSHSNNELRQKMIDEMEDDEDEYIEYEDFYIILSEDAVELFNEDTFVITNTEESAKNFIDRYYSKSSQPSLADVETFQEGFLRLYENSEIFYYLDLTVIGDLVEEAANKYEAAYAPLVQQGQLAPTPNILEALGLDALQGIAAAVDMDPSELRMKNLFLVESNDGFFGKLFNHYGNSLPDTSFMGEELRQAMASSFDLSGMLHDLEDTVAAISPFAGQMYQMQKFQFEQTLNIQVDEALIDNFSGSIYVASGETPNTSASALSGQSEGMESFFDQGSTIIIGINDRISLEALIDSLLASFNQQERISKQDYLGVSNYVINTAVPTPGPTFFVSDQHFIIEQSNPNFGKLVVSMMQNPGQPIFQRRDVRDSFNELPPDPMGVTYNDAEKLFSFVTKLMRGGMASFSQSSGPDEGNGDSESVEWPEIPIIEDFSYFTITNTYKEDDGFYQESILRPKTN